MEGLSCCVLGRSVGKYQEKLGGILGRRQGHHIQGLDKDLCGQQDLLVHNNCLDPDSQEGVVCFQESGSVVHVLVWAAYQESVKIC